LQKSGSRIRFHALSARDGGVKLTLAGRCEMFAYVKGFGCRPVATVRLALGPSSESLQGRNAREVVCRRCRARYGDLIAAMRVNARRRTVAVVRLRGLVGPIGLA
jgi:hypothetical protein